MIGSHGVYCYLCVLMRGNGHFLRRTSDFNVERHSRNGRQLDWIWRKLVKEECRRGGLRSETPVYHS